MPASETWTLPAVRGRCVAPLSSHATIEEATEAMTRRHPRAGVRASSRSATRAGTSRRSPTGRGTIFCAQAWAPSSAIASTRSVGATRAPTASVRSGVGRRRASARGRADRVDGQRPARGRGGRLCSARAPDVVVVGERGQKRDSRAPTGHAGPASDEPLAGRAGEEHRLRRGGVARRRRLDALDPAQPGWLQACRSDGSAGPEGRSSRGSRPARANRSEPSPR